MKQTVIATMVLALGAAFAVGAPAQGRHDARPHGVVRASGVGVIKGIDASGKMVTLEHETVRKFQLNAATHEFRVKDSKLLVTLREGDRVDFVLEKSGPNFVVVQLGKPKAK